MSAQFMILTLIDVEDPAKFNDEAVTEALSAAANAQDTTRSVMVVTGELITEAHRRRLPEAFDAAVGVATTEARS